MSPDPVREGPSLTRVDGAWACARDLVGDRVILIHGFTASSVYLRAFARYFQDQLAEPLLYDYDSYLGIDVAAAQLVDLLDNLRQPGDRSRFVVVAHSMGGLVARRFLRLVAEREDDAVVANLVVGACYLGTPHAGTLVGQPGVSPLADISDLLTGMYPFLRSPLCRSAKQLTQSDADGFIKTLNAADRDAPLKVPTLTVSGGLSHLEFCNGRIRNGLVNQFVQNILRTPNDGLVGESSANLQNVLGRLDLPITHDAAYPAYETTNHTYLIRSQSIAARVARWCRDRF
jgi:pimeloyl-ACP methyl ester carboxylesterase